MNKKLLGILLAVVIVAGVGVAYAYNQQQKQTAAEKEAMMREDTMPTDAGADKEEVMTPENKAMADKNAEVMQKRGEYKDYSEATVATEQRAGQKVVLFFHAPWCPYCRAADAAFKASPDKIPAGVTVLKTDYDSHAALKQKYGVTYQHTFVQIDAQGNLVTKWLSGDVDLLTKNVK